MPAPSLWLAEGLFRAWLDAKNLSVRRVSDMTGISRTSFNAWSKGRPVSSKMADRLISEVGLPPRVLKSRFTTLPYLPRSRRRTGEDQMLLWEVAL
jgi:transcriptional regulator with XRE-family HTH domain